MYGNKGTVSFYLFTTQYPATALLAQSKIDQQMSMRRKQIIVCESHDYWYCIIAYTSLQLELDSKDHQPLTWVVKKWKKYIDSINNRCTYRFSIVRVDGQVRRVARAIYDGLIMVWRESLG